MRGQIGIAITVLSLAACGPDSEPLDMAAERLAEAERKVGQAVHQEPPRNIGEAFEKVGAAIGGLSDVTESVPAGDLKAMLPERVGNLKRTGHDVQKGGGFGIEVSKAQGTYSNDDGGQMSILITDLGTVSGLAKMGLDLFETDIDRADANGFERSGEYRGYRSFQRLQKKGNQSLAEMMLYVGERFTVQIDAQNVAWEQVEKAAAAIDLDALAALHTVAKKDN